MSLAQGFREWHDNQAADKTTIAKAHFGLGGMHILHRRIAARRK